MNIIGVLCDIEGKEVDIAVNEDSLNEDFFYAYDVFTGSVVEIVKNRENSIQKIYTLGESVRKAAKEKLSHFNC